MRTTAGLQIMLWSLACYINTYYMSNKMESLNWVSGEETSGHADSVTEMLVAEPLALSGLRRWLIMSSDISTPWRPASATLNNALVAVWMRASLCVRVCVCVVQGFTQDWEAKVKTVACRIVLSLHNYRGIIKGCIFSSCFKEEKSAF